MPIKRKPLPTKGSTQLQTNLGQESGTVLRSPLRQELKPGVILDQPSFDITEQVSKPQVDTPPPHSYTSEIPYGLTENESSGCQDDSLPSIPFFGSPIELVRTADSIASSMLASPVDSVPSSLGSSPVFPGDAFFGSPDTDSCGSGPDSGTNTAEPKGKLTSALEDASIFLGGLIKHPTESTKHFTILRHSHGLVYYKGPSTSIAITVFGDRPLPTDRRYWLQMKGWTGDTGMRAKALLRTNSSWINATPVRRVVESELSAMDERAWQRDIRKFEERIPKKLKKQAIRETAVIRVPYEAVDGYFRIVLTEADSRYPLCPSPVFRVASTSMSASSIKGASLSTLPLELSINILQMMAKTTATTAVAPYASTAKSQVVGMMPSTVAKYGTTAYDASRISERTDRLNKEYDQRLNQTTRIAGEIMSPNDNKGQQIYTSMPRPTIVGDDSGPIHPFPIHLSSKIVRGTGRSRADLGMPNINLPGISALEIATLLGVYFGWAMIDPPEPKSRTPTLSRLQPELSPRPENTKIDCYSQWYPTIVTIAHSHAERASVAHKKTVRAYILFPQDLSPGISGLGFASSYPPLNKQVLGQPQPHLDFTSCQASVILMGYLRPSILHPSHFESPLHYLPIDVAVAWWKNMVQTETVSDIRITQSSLAREAWSAPEMLTQIQSAKSERSFTDRYVGTRNHVQKRVDSLPIHKVGVRMDGVGVKDRGMVGNGGMYIVRG